jgi:hypothetical protein
MHTGSIVRASIDDVPIVATRHGYEVELGKLYLDADGHAALTFRPVEDLDFEGARVPVGNVVELMGELLYLIERMQREATGQRPRIWVREPATRPVYQAR